MKRTFFVTILPVFVLLAACRKTTANIKAESNLIGRWNLKTYTVNDFLGSQPRTTNGSYKAGEYMQFDPGGICSIRVDNTVTPTIWKLLNDDKTLYIRQAGVLDLPDDGYTIKTLTDHNLVIDAKEGTGQNASETVIYLEK